MRAATNAPRVGSAVAFEKAPQRFQFKKDKVCYRKDILHRVDFERSVSSIVFQVYKKSFVIKGSDGLATR